MDEGHSFVWPAGGILYFLTPWAAVIPLMVDDYIPYLHPGSDECAPRPLESKHLRVPSPQEYGMPEARGSPL